MAWAFVGVSAAVTVTATGHTLTEPAGCQAGDLLVAVISSRIASTTSITLPAGWTLVAESKTNNVVAAGVTSEASGMMAYIVRGDAAPALNFTHPTAPSVAMGRIVAYRGENVWSPFDVGIGAKTGTSITAISTTGLTTAEANELIVKGVCSGRASALSAHDAATDPTTSSAAGAVQTAAPIVGTWQERQDSSTTTGADTALAIADAIRGTAGATGVLTCTASVSGGHCQVAGAFKLEPVATPGSSTIAKTGSTLDFVASSANAGTVSSTITVPSDAELVCVGVKAWCSEANYFTGMTFTKGGSDVAMTKVGTPEVANSQRAMIFYLALPDTGANKSLKFDWAGTNPPGETPMISVTFWKGIDTASPVRSSGASLEALNSAAFPTRTTLLTAQNGDLVVALAGGDSAAFLEGSVNTWYNLNLVSQCVTGAAIRHDAAWGSFAPSANLYVGADTSTNLLYGVCAAIVLKPAPSKLVSFAHNQNNALTSVTATIPATQAGDCIIFAGLVNSLGGLQVKTNNNDVGVFGTLGGVQSPRAGFAGISSYVGLIANPTVGSTSVTISGTNATEREIGVWVVRGLTNPTQDKGVWTTGQSGSINVSGLTGTLADAVEFAVSYNLAGNNTTGINLAQTGSGGFVLDTVATPFFASGFSHQDTTATTQIQGAWDVAGGGGDTLCATYRSGPSGVTGTLTETEDADVAAMTGNVTRIANLATTEAIDVTLINATVRWAATLATTEAVDTAALTGTVRRVVDLATTEAPDGAAFTGAVTTAPGGNATDNFNRADGGLGANWSPLTQASFQALQIASNQVRNNRDNFDVAVWTADNFESNHFSEIKLASANIQGLAKVVRVQSPLSACNLYYCFFHADGKVIIGRMINGTSSGGGATDLVTAPPGTASPYSIGDVLRFEANGSTLTAKKNGVTYASVSDATHTGGRPGIMIHSATPRGDDWSGGPTVGGTPVGSLITTEAEDVAAFTGTIFTPVSGFLSYIEPADTAALVGGIFGTGTLATTEGVDVAALTGTVRWQATLATTEAKDAAAFSGVVRDPIAATLATIEAADVVAALVGAVRWVGALAAIEAPDVAAFTGNVFTPVTGTLARVEAPDVAAFAGGIYGTGTLAAIEAGDAPVLLGTVRWSAVLAASEAADAAAFLGSVFTPISASLAATELPDVAALSGSVRWATVLSASETPDSAAFTGNVQWLGTLATTEAPDWSVIVGAVYTQLEAVLATTEPPDAGAFTGGTYGAGTLAATEAPDLAALAGATRWAVTLAAVEPPDAGAFTATVRWAATLATTEAADAAAFLGNVKWIGTLAASEAPDSAAFIGGIYASGFLSVREGADTYDGVGLVIGEGLVGLLSTEEPPDTAVFTATLSGGAGTLVATEAPDKAAFTATVRWIATLSTREAADAASFLAIATSFAALDAREYPDGAAFTIGTRWIVTLAATEAPDIALFKRPDPGFAYLAVTEPPDGADFTGSGGFVGYLWTVEPSDVAVFGANVAHFHGVLDTTEAPDVAKFTSAAPDIAYVPGRFLRSDPLRVRELASQEPRARDLAPLIPSCRELARGSQRVRTLKYPIPRTHELVKNLNIHELTGA